MKRGFFWGKIRPLLIFVDIVPLGLGVSIFSCQKIQQKIIKLQNCQLVLYTGIQCFNIHIFSFLFCSFFPPFPQMFVKAKKKKGLAVIEKPLFSLDLSSVFNFFFFFCTFTTFLLQTAAQNQKGGEKKGII